MDVARAISVLHFLTSEIWGWGGVVGALIPHQTWKHLKSVVECSQLFKTFPDDYHYLLSCPSSTRTTFFIQNEHGFLCLVLSSCLPLCLVDPLSYKYSMLNEESLAELFNSENDYICIFCIFFFKVLIFLEIVILFFGKIF